MLCGGKRGENSGKNAKVRTKEEVEGIIAGGFSFQPGWENSQCGPGSRGGVEKKKNRASIKEKRHYRAKWSGEGQTRPCKVGGKRVGRVGGGEKSQVRVVKKKDGKVCIH